MVTHNPLSEKQTTDLNRFYHYLESERRYSPHTLVSYQRDLRVFTTFCENSVDNSEREWSAISEHTVRMFVAAQHRKGLSGRSLQRQLSSIRSLFNFLCRHHLANHNPAQGVPAPKAPKRLPNTLGVDQLNQLLSMPAEDALARRDLAAMELLYG